MIFHLDLLFVSSFSRYLIERIYEWVFYWFCDPIMIGEKFWQQRKQQNALRFKVNLPSKWNASGRTNDKSRTNKKIHWFQANCMKCSERSSVRLISHCWAQHTQWHSLENECERVYLSPIYLIRLFVAGFVLVRFIRSAVRSSFIVRYVCQLNRI